MRVGSIVEVDRTHLPVALHLAPEVRRCAGKVLSVVRGDDADPVEKGWLYLVVHSAKANVTLAVAVPPAGTKHGGNRGPKVRVIR